jgi:hypothetical protein
MPTKSDLRVRASSSTVENRVLVDLLLVSGANNGCKRQLQVEAGQEQEQGT